MEDEASGTVGGALQYIDSEAIRRGLAAIRTGERHSLGLPIRHGAGPMAVMRQPPQHFMVRDGADHLIASGGKGIAFPEDVIFLATHGVTHLDAFSHVFENGVAFDGLTLAEVTSAGAIRHGIETLPPIATRALVVDAVPEGRPWLDPGEVITAEDICSRLDAAGLQPKPGDALVVRTGWVEAVQAGAADNLTWPGIGDCCTDWLSQSRFSVIAADNIAVEVGPSGIPGVALPMTLRLMLREGVALIQLLDLSAFRGRTCEGFFTVNPLKINQAVGSPVAPMLVT